MPNAQCKHCGYARTAVDELGMYCAGCGRPRLPFASYFVGVWLLLTGTYFLGQTDTDLLRPLLIVVLLGAAVWCSVLIMRHRKAALARLLAVFLPTVVIAMSIPRWESPSTLAWPGGLVVLNIVVTIAAILTLAISYGVAAKAGFRKAREDARLRADSLILTWLTLIGILITVAYFALPYVTAALRDWLRGTRSWEGVKNWLAGFSDVLQFIVDARFVLILLLAFVVIALATIAALRDKYVYPEGKFSVLSTIARILRGIVSNVLRLIWSTIERWWLILLGILPTTLVLLGGVLFIGSVSTAAGLIKKLWLGDAFFELTFPQWFILLGSVLGALVSVILMNAVVSQNFTSMRTALGGVRRDFGGLTQAVGFSFFIVTLAFTVTWIIALAYRIATGSGGFGGFLFIATVVAYGGFALVSWLRREKVES